MTISEASGCVEARQEAGQEARESKKEEVKHAIEAPKDARDLKQAQQLADRFEDNAAGSIAFALMAIAEAEMAVVDAVDARLYATSLAQTEG